ncbi:CRISPR-associated protein, GSU0054 [Desulfonatronospira thiodismutans ASO3-1]|uniref:CRISPR-associated protein, GSU0054 n=1 Tax=Desulfonatronospira thiodismutans ASO3-1 TaxID=555779 RepID=D6STU9_9BACT|nr:type I-U CRISPR-associated protein Csb2 [Desulfonatronospira thiodismutans]EFI34115.1 CRISPR-associated protein, GSU0054 [Desulfonatronospira thiodismutans ASO3-1]
MLALEFTFPAGRYHANPWGRNVNEGEAEWPPSPYRLARALIDIQKRRFPDWEQARIESVLQGLSGKPFYLLPQATTAHIRTYQSSNEKDVTKKQLIFDSFVALDKGDSLYMAFENSMQEQHLVDLGTLLEELNYLGRSESWVKVNIRDNVPSFSWDCLPSDSAGQSSVYEDEKIACVLPRSEYESLPVSSDLSWFEAICLSTRDLLNQGWAHPPALEWIDYSRKKSRLNRTIPSRAGFESRREYRLFKYEIHSRVRPMVQESIHFAERIRLKLMGIHRKIQGDDPGLVSSKFSGKSADGSPLEGHGHAFFLPLDEDHDGRIDSLVITAREPFDSSELMALDRLRSIWQSNGKPDASLILSSMREQPNFKLSRTWVSATPFVTTRHHRKGRGSYLDWLTQEILLECEYHGLPEPASVNWIQWTITGPKPLRWMEFARGKRDERPFRGHGCIIHFNTAVPGPFALGARCHFGLGLFQPVE